MAFPPKKKSAPKKAPAKKKDVPFPEDERAFVKLFWAGIQTELTAKIEMLEKEIDELAGPLIRRRDELCQQRAAAHNWLSENRDEVSAEYDKWVASYLDPDEDDEGFC